MWQIKIWGTTKTCNFFPKLSLERPACLKSKIQKIITPLGSILPEWRSQFFKTILLRNLKQKVELIGKKYFEKLKLFFRIIESVSKTHGILRKQSDVQRFNLEESDHHGKKLAQNSKHYQSESKLDSEANSFYSKNKRSNNAGKQASGMIKQPTKIPINRRNNCLPDLSASLPLSDKFEKLFRYIWIGDGPEIGHLKLWSINKNNLKLFFNKRYPPKVTDRIVSANFL